MGILTINEVIVLEIMLRIPVCNLIACEDIFIRENAKVYIYNPFTAISGGSIKRFYTYAVIQGIPNGMMTFKVQIMSPRNKIVKESSESTVMVEENIIRVKTKWHSINFSEGGEHRIILLIKCNNEYDIAGSACVYIL